MPTYKQKTEFLKEISSYLSIDDDAMEQAIDFIKRELEPDEVFSFQQLSQWAEDNGYTKE